MSIKSSIGGTDGNNGSGLVYDANGKALGWALYMTGMDEPVQSYIDEGLSTWIK